MLTTSEWGDYFAQNRQDPLPVAWDEPVVMPATARAVIGRSLARFQLGESSEGRQLRAGARRTGDPAYAAAIDLFIREEQDHARLLGVVLDRWGIARLRRHWSDWLFRRCRHALGFQGEIAVLLMAEIVALKYYSLVRQGTNDAAVRAVCDQILHDEKFHVRFHCEMWHRRIAPWPRWAQRLVARLLTVLFAGASGVVAWDHRAALVALGGSAENFLEESWANFAAARQAIVTGQSFVWSRATQRVESPQPAPRPEPVWRDAWAVVRLQGRWLWRPV